MKPDPVKAEEVLLGIRSTDYIAKDVSNGLIAVVQEFRREVRSEEPPVLAEKFAELLRATHAYSQAWVACWEAVGYLRGYELPAQRLAEYKCTFCKKKGVKLWRGIHSDAEAWCSTCATKQAGLADTVDVDGRIEDSFGGPHRTDQIYSSKKGQNLLPYVPAVDGGTWGYTSVPPEGCIWWRSLPTRLDG